MKYFYHKGTGGFYNDVVHREIPEGSVELTEKEYDLFLEALNSGKDLKVSGDKISVVEKPVDLDSIAYSVRKLRDKLLNKVSIRIEKCLDQEEDVSSLRKYRIFLRDVPEQIGFPETVEWSDGTHSKEEFLDG